MKLLPFDLQKAQSGHPWGTRDGRKGKKIFDTERVGELRLVSILENEFLLTTDVNGNYHNKGESNSDLFLVEEKKKEWVVIYKDFDGINARPTTGEIYKNALEETTKANGTYIKTVEVEY